MGQNIKCKWAQKAKGDRGCGTLLTAASRSKTTIQRRLGSFRLNIQINKRFLLERKFYFNCKWAWFIEVKLA